MLTAAEELLALEDHERDLNGRLGRLMREREDLIRAIRSLRTSFTEIDARDYAQLVALRQLVR